MEYYEQGYNLFNDSIDLNKRIKGLYMLENLMNESIELHWHIIDILIKYIRNNCKEFENQINNRAKTYENTILTKHIIDTLINRNIELEIESDSGFNLDEIILNIRYAFKNKDINKYTEFIYYLLSIKKIDLSNLYLNGLLLVNSKIINIDFSNTVIARSNFIKSSFEFSYFRNTNLHNNIFFKSSFYNVDFEKFLFEKTFFSETTFIYPQNFSEKSMTLIQQSNNLIINTV